MGSISLQLELTITGPHPDGVTFFVGIRQTSVGGAYIVRF